jgi:hypothetical protein
MRPSSTVALAAGVAAGLAALPPHADATTRHPTPEPARRALSPTGHRLRPWTGIPHHARMPTHADEWSGPRSIASIVSRFESTPDEPVFSDDEEPVPDLLAPGASSSDDHPSGRHPRVHRDRPSRARRPVSHDHPAVRARSSTGDPFREDRVPDDPWPVVGAASVCVDVDVVAIVRVVIEVDCDCPPPPHRVRRPSPRPSPPRRTRPVVAERPRPPARPPAAPKAPSPSVAPPAHRAVTPRAAVPQRRKNPMGSVMFLVVLTVVISAGAGIAFAGAR